MRALIIADHTLAAEAIRRELRHAAACEVIGYVDGRRPCADAVATANPDVVVIDEMTPQTPLITRIQEIRVGRSRPPSCCSSPSAWTTSSSPRPPPPASTPPWPRPCTPAASACWSARSPAATSSTPSPRCPSSAPCDSFGLTARELEILRLVAAGLSNARIAAKLWVTEQTVKFHLSNVYRKLGVGNRTEASHHAHVHGMLGHAPAPVALPVAVAA